MTADALPDAAERHLRAFARALGTDAGAAVRRARQESVPITVLARLDDALPAPLRGDADWQAAVARDLERAERVARAQAQVAAALADVGGVALAPPLLGPGWSSDVDVFARADALPAAAAALEAAGAVPLEGVLDALRPPRRPGAQPRHFAVAESGEVLAGAELLTELWTRGASAAAAVDRASERRLAARDVAARRVGKLAAARRPTVRGLVELVVLLERGVALPAGLARGVLARHAALESELGGPGAVTAAAAAAPRRPGAVVAWVAARAGSALRTLRRPRQLRVAFCGVDGAGKSTQASLLETHLDRAGIPARARWTRLGNKASAPVAELARLAQRLLPRGTHSYESVREEAGRRAGDGVAQVAPPLTRRGPVGWAWALAVTVDYVLRARAAARRERGRVLVLDRALPDALVELEDNYGVALRLGLQRRILERWTPRPHLAFYLRLPGAVAKARKDDTFTAAELEVQRERYERLLERLDGVVVLDAQRPREELALEVLRRLGRRSP